MSGWIKVEKSLKDDPRILRMASRLRNADVTLGGKSSVLVIGALVMFWWYADTHIRDDDTLDVGPSEIDEIVGLAGFCDLIPEDWLRKVDDHCVELPGFQAHNGVEAKKKALGAKRQSKHRDKRNAHSVTKQSPSALPDQTRPDHKKKDPQPVRKGENEEPGAASRGAVQDSIGPDPDLDPEAYLVWSSGLTFLGGEPKRSLLGKLVKQYGRSNVATKLGELMRMSEPVDDPAGYLIGAMRKFDRKAVC